MPESPSVMLVDDHDLFRAGLRTLLEKEGIHVVCDSAGSDRVFDLVRRYRPDVVLIDVSMQAVGGVALTGQLLEQFPDLRVVMLTLSEEPVDVYGAVRAGARGYMFKGTPTPELVAGIRAVGAGHGCISHVAAGKLMEIVHTGRIPRLLDTDMSEREIEVLRLMASGFDNNQIAAELNISAKTVKNHISSIFTKLEMNNRVQAAVYAVRSGLA